MMEGVGSEHQTCVVDLFGSVLFSLNAVSVSVSAGGSATVFLAKR